MHATMHARGRLDSHRQIGFFVVSGLFRFVGESRPSSRAPRGITRAVETVEKVPFQKMIFEKWDRNCNHQIKGEQSHC